VELPLRNCCYIGVLALFLSGCMNSITQPMMKDVMASCESYTNFSDYNSCIQTDYKKNPNKSDVRAFYAILNSIDEDYRDGKLSEIKARAAAHSAYLETIAVGNRAVYNSYSGPTITNCSTYGSQTSCTSW